MATATVASLVEEQSKENIKVANYVSEVGQWAGQVDSSFDRVVRWLTDVAENYSNDFPSLIADLNDTQEHKQQWIAFLSLSQDISSNNSVVLNKFEMIFIEMVETIQTDKDRQDCIEELGTIADVLDERIDKFAAVAQDFTDLGRVIRFLGINIQIFITKTRDDLEQWAKELEDSGELEKLEEIKKRIAILSKMLPEFTELKPEVALISEKVNAFAQVWSTLQDQTVAFQNLLRIGRNAGTNMVFKLDMQATRDTATPLKNSLESYAKELANRS